MTRQLVGLLGIVLAVFGLAYDAGWLIWLAAAVMGLSIVGRVIEARRARRRADDIRTPES
ncbi:MAG TPA: hypothetical protein VFZ13_15110 [Gemmatimonadales bacterium]